MIFESYLLELRPRGEPGTVGGVHFVERYVSVGDVSGGNSCAAVVFATGFSSSAVE